MTHQTREIANIRELVDELHRLREDNEALRFASLSFAELAERLARRVRELEHRLLSHGFKSP